MKPNTTYTVEVAFYAGQWEAYGAPCTITTGATVPRYSPFESDGLENAEIILGLSVYPNPALVNEQYSIEIQGIASENEKIQLSIYTLIGAKVYHAELLTQNESTLTIKPEVALAAGVYMAEAQLGEKLYRVKFVVK